MSELRKALLIASVSAAMLFSSVVQAMEIRQFDKMPDQDQADYVVALINGAEKVLTDEGRADLAAQVEHLFTTKNSGDVDVVGMVEFERNLAILRVADAKNAAAHPNDPRLEVEDAMAVMLKNVHGIDLPKSFFTVNSGFQPKHTPPAKDSKDKKN